MSSEYIFNPPIKFEELCKAVLKVNGTFAKQASANIGAAHYALVKDDQWVYAFTTPDYEQVTSLVRYGSNDPTWVIDLLREMLGIEGCIDL